MQSTLVPNASATLQTLTHPSSPQLDCPVPSSPEAHELARLTSQDSFLRDTFATDHPGYDEVYSPRGSVRTPYRGVVDVLEQRTVGQVEQFKKNSLADFQGDNVLVAVPRMLRPKEATMLRRGIEQRGRALQAFLSDYYSGTKSYDSAGIIPEVVLREIIQRNNEDGFEAWLDSSNISFWYGPDIIRDSNGEFRIIEDNPGYVGGMGDLIKAQQIMFKYMPDLKSVVNTPNPGEFYSALLENYRQRSKGGSDTVVMIRYSNTLASDNEDKRLQKIMEGLGVETVMLSGKSGDKRFKNSLKITKNGVYLQTKGHSPRKVGFVIAGIEPCEIDPAHPAVFSGNLRRVIANELEAVELKLAKFSARPGASSIHRSLEEKFAFLKQLLKPGEDGLPKSKAITTYLESSNPNALEDITQGGFPGLLDAFYDEKVGMNNTPGAEFIGDKEFYMYVDRMIEYYLNEQPIIKNLPTRSFRTFDSQGKATLDETLFNQVFDSQTQPKDSYVLKKVDGRGGKSVWVGAKMPDWNSFEALKTMVTRDPSAFIVQKYTPLSQVDGHLVDLRLLSDINSTQTVVAPVPWGRAVRAKGSNGKVNISDNGGEQVVMVSSTAPRPKPAKRTRNLEPTLASSRSRRSGLDNSAKKIKIRHNNE